MIGRYRYCGGRSLGVFLKESSVSKVFFQHSIAFVSLSGRRILCPIKVKKRENDDVNYVKLKTFNDF